MRYLTTEGIHLVSVIIGVIAMLLSLYSAWSLGRNLPRWWKKTYHTGSLSLRYVDRKNFLLSLIAAHEPEVKGLLDLPPDEVIVAVSHPPDGSVPKGMVIAKVGGQTKQVILPLSRKSPVLPLFEAILGMRFDVDQESELMVGEEAHVG